MNHRQVGVLVSAGHPEVVSGRRPFPVHGAPAKSSPNRVVVEVLQGRRNGLNRKYIPVETGALLPKPKARLPRSFQHSQPRQERRALPCQNFLDLLRERLLDSSQIKTDRRIRSPRIDEQMHMFRHENKPDQFRRCLLASRVNASCQLLPPRVVRQQRHTTIAREGQLVYMADVVKMAYRLTMCHRPFLSTTGWNTNPPATLAKPVPHTNTGKASATHQHWQSQWHTPS